MPDASLDLASRIVIDTSLMGPRPIVRGFFDPETFTISYVVHDTATRRAAVIDPTLRFDPASGRIGYGAVDEIATYIRAHNLQIDWLLETHVHADHLSAAPYLQEHFGGRLAIGSAIVTVQETFGKVFNFGTEFERDGSDFDELLTDGSRFALGGVQCTALHVPGHTPADMAYVLGDAVFCGDTLFMPDVGTARADFPGGDAAQLYRSIRRLLKLPDDARLFVCHDYKAPGRDAFAWETSVGAQRLHNVQVKEGIDERAFVIARNARDCTLAVPRLIIPSLQVNMRGGKLPPVEDNGRRYLRVPLDSL